MTAGNDCLARTPQTSSPGNVNEVGESSTMRVILLSVGVMVLEIVCGTLFGSMALLADGWHMGTHVFALGITVVAYRLARKYANDDRFSFGTGKIGVLGGFVSALFLAAVAGAMIYESTTRLISPITIRFNEAIIVAIIGLTVNTISAVWLHRGLPSDHHDHRKHGRKHHDHNLKAAYLHVIADALTSVLAIIALIAGKFLGWVWLDAIVGIVGALVILRWAWGLLRNTAVELVDFYDNPDLKEELISIIEAKGCCQVREVKTVPFSSGNHVVIIGSICHRECTVRSIRQELTNHIPNIRPIIELTICKCQNRVMN